MQQDLGKRLTKSLDKAPKTVLVAGLILLVLLVVFGFFQLQAPSTLSVQKNDETNQEEVEETFDNKVMVDVSGEVQSPGMYTITSEDPRVNDAVLAAGGLTSEADTQSINLAQKIEDGEKIFIPKKGDVQENPGNTTTSNSKDQAASSKGLVNINTASAEQLQSLPGVGAATAQAIIKDREQNGKFKSKEDLMRVSGIGEKKYAKLEGSICV